jgi:DNA-binding winged helix-turn-helix (wHTH) protein/tetratricopeptide (TPR) repeat protein
VTYLFEEYELDEENFCLLRDGQRLSLEPKSLRVLLLLVSNRGKLIEKSTILETVWAKTFVEDTTLTRAIALLRKQLGDDPRRPKFIETVPTLGYRFIALVTIASAPGSPPQAEGQASRIEATEPAAIIAPAVAATDSQGGSSNGRLRQTRRAKPYLLGAAVALSLVLGAVGVYRFSRRSTRLLAGKGAIVLSDFTNSTGDPVFDDTLRQGLTVQLEQSPLLTVVGDEQIRRTLVLMGQSVDARLTAVLSRDLCQRADAAAVLDGSIAHLGSQYVLGLRARDCYTGALLDAEQVQVARKEDVLDGLSRITSRFRGRIGESLASVKQRDTPLPEATTPSLDALKAYSTGLKLLVAQGPGAALPVFQSATELDPGFAMAHAYLGRMYGDLGEEDLAENSVRRAYGLREHASEKERYFITSSYQIQVSGNMIKARETCEAWERAYPRDVVPRGFLSGFIYPGLQRYESAILEANKAIEIDPDTFIWYGNLANNALALGRIGQAEEALQRASEHHLDMNFFSTERYRIAFLKSDSNGMQQVADAAREDHWMLNQQASVLAYYGRLSDARQLSRRALDLARQSPRNASAPYFEGKASLTEVISGNTEEARRHAHAALALSRGRNAESLAAFSLALAGESSQADALADDLDQRFPEDTFVQFDYVPAIRALTALSHNHPQRAIELLQVTAPYELGAVLDPIYVRGIAYLALHRGVEATVEFQKFLDHPGIVFYDPVAFGARLHLAQAYTLSGDRTAAKAACADFLKLWRDADPGVPLLKQAKFECARLQ